MNACADNKKTDFLDLLQDDYNQSVYFIESCNKFPTKYSAQYLAMDLSLSIFFQENNKIYVNGKCMKYCDKDNNRRKIKLQDISNEVNLPEINIVNNYFADDKWDKIDW